MSENDIDLGIIAQGPKGDKGDTGPQGPQGPKGDKGDTGTVDNAGLTTAPAFVKLQTQVNNSAVGTNLLTDTSNFSNNWNALPSVSTTTEYNGHPSMVVNSSTERLSYQKFGLGKLENSFQYTSSFWAKADNAGDKARTLLWGDPKPFDFVLTTNWVRYTAVVTSFFDANTNADHAMYFLGVPDGNKGNVYIALPKLEKGSVATDWIPAPEDRGDRGLSIWFSKYARGGNLGSQYWSDLYNTKIGFGPQVGDLTIQPNGMITQVTRVKVDNSATTGGGTFDIGDVIGNMQGHTPVRGTDYWTDADKNEIKSYVNDAILKGKW